MADEDTAARAAKIDKALAKADADEGNQGRTMAALDSIAKVCDSISKRMDAFEAGAKKKPEEKPTAERETEGDEGDDEPGDREAVADAAMMDHGQMREDSASKRADAERKESERRAEIQRKADAVFATHGEQAPRPMAGETAAAYRVRALGLLRHYSSDFRNVDLAKVKDAATFDAIEKRIFADAVAASYAPEVAEGYLREVKKTDASGRQMSNFYGSPRTWMQQFGCPPRRVAGIRNRTPA